MEWKTGQTTANRLTYRPLIGVALWRVGDLGPAGFAAAAAAGVDYVQIDLGGPNRGPDLTNVHEMDAVVEASRRFKLPIAALALNRLNDLRLTAPKGGREAAQVHQSILRAIEVAVRLQTSRIIIPGFRKSLVRSPKDAARTAEVLRFALGLAQAAGVTLAYESQLGADGTLGILRTAGQPGVQVQFDTGNPVIHGHSAAAIWSRVAAVAAPDVHVKDVGESAEDDLPLGTGHAALPSTFAAFARYCRPSSFTLEGNYSADTVSRIQRDIARLKTLFATYLNPTGRD